MSCPSPCLPLRALGLLTVLLASPAARAGAPERFGPVPPLSAVGRWFTDAAGRVVLLHGVNDVEKSPPYYSAHRGFDADDTAFLAAEGFNTLRLGVDMRGLMPIPGQVETAYIEHLAETVDLATDAGLFVLLDFHQDGFSPMFNGNGFPDWMAITDGLPNPPDAFFPLYYITNPAMQRAFEHFWDDSPGPNDIPLQTYFLQAVEAVVTRFKDDPMVLGTELMNEPWPGANWQPCVLPPTRSCPDQEQAKLMPFYRRGLARARAIAPKQWVFVEPFVLFNFGQGPTTLPGPDPGFALSFHSYAVDVPGEEAVARLGAEAATRDGAPVVVTEFGASTDPVLLNRLTNQFDREQLSWMFWHYGEQIVRDSHRPPTGDNIRSHAALDALVRPYPLAVTGIPTQIAFDPTTKQFDLVYTTDRPDGGPYPRRLDTVIFVPSRHYPHGYTAKVKGAHVTSRRCAERLTVRTFRPGRPVTVRITPRPPRTAGRPFCR